MVVLTNFMPATTGILYTENDTEAYVQGKSQGMGMLYIAESRLSWKCDGTSSFSIEYPAIGTHGICRDRSRFAKDCLYMILDGSLQDCAEVVDGHEEEDEDDENPIIEVHFVPQNTESLVEIMESINKCQILHPDEDEDRSSEEGEDEEEEKNGGDEEDYVDVDKTELGDENVAKPDVCSEGKFEDAVTSLSGANSDFAFFSDEMGFEHLTKEGLRNLERFNNMLSAQLQSSLATNGHASHSTESSSGLPSTSGSAAAMEVEGSASTAASTSAASTGLATAMSVDSPSNGIVAGQFDDA